MTKKVKLYIQNKNLYIITLVYFCKTTKYGNSEYYYIHD